MRTPVAVLFFVLAGLVVTGCGAKEETQGYEKANFDKKPVPAGFGPGGGAPAAPPSTTTGQ